jgi:ATP/maltotriose-dependent transcriptional regulator MalT/DNA-binding SARP family transcriptional activator
MAKKKLVLAKLTSPTLPRVIERKRLFRLLDGATKYPLTWIAAPPGAGKTTLLASYAKMHRRSVLWYRLDAGDADPSTFFHYLVLAVQAAAPRVRHPLLHLTPEYFAGLPIFTQRFFEAVGSMIHRPTMLVFDNYHEVPAEALLHQLLPLGIQRLPPHIRVVILSRETYPQGYMQLVAERQLQTMRPEELELTQAEAAQVYRLQVTRRKPPTNSKAIAQCWEVVRGWMAGFILLVEREVEGNVTGELPTQTDPHVVFEYLAGEVMTRLPADVQQVLTTMSLVGDFTHQMAVALTGRPEAGRILERLHHNRYFIERREDRTGWYRYHPLFREFLLRRAEQMFDVKNLRRIRESAASFLLDVKLEGEAADLLKAAAAWDSYRTLIKQYGPILVQQGRVHTLETWIRHLPESERAADPWMDLWLAHCHLSLAPKEATSLYESAFNRFRERGEQEPMFLAWAGVVHSIIFSYSGMKRISDWLQVFDEIHLPGSAFPSSEVEQLVTDALAVGYTYIAPDQPEARRWLNRTVALWDKKATPVGPFSKYFTEHCFIGFDDFATLHVLFTKSKKDSERSGASPVERILHYLLTGALGWLQADVEECRRAVKEGLALCESTGLLVFRVLLISHGIYNELLIGNVGAARTLLEQIKPLALSMGGLHLTHFLMLASWADLIEDRLGEAWQRCQRSTEVLESEGSPMFQSALQYFMESQVLAARGNREIAQQTLARVETVGQAMPSMQLTNGVYFLRAQWAFQDGDDVSGTSWLRRLLEEGQTSPRIGFVGWVPQEASRLFAKALELGIEVPYALEVIRKRQLKPPTDGSAPENWPWRVKIHAFGKLTLEVDGKPLEKHRKAPHRLLELLAAIVAFGGHDVPVSRLIDALWPDVDGDTAHENFKKSIARLRKLLAVDDVINWQDGKISLNRDLCWVDMLTFEHQAQRIESLAVEKNHTAQVPTQTLALYTGPFLGLGEPLAWGHADRDRARMTFVRLVNRHCDRLQTAERVEETIRSLERAIAVDPLAEPLYQRLIPLLTAQGRRTDAVEAYHRCRTSLARWADRDPSVETQRLFQQLQTH